MLFTILFFMNPYRAIPEKTAPIVNLCATLALVLSPVIATAVATAVDFHILSHAFRHPLFDSTLQWLSRHKVQTWLAVEATFVIWHSIVAPFSHVWIWVDKSIRDNWLSP